MADYAASANAIYDPQANADRTAATSARDSSLSDIAAAKAELNPYYSKAFSQLTTGENNAQGQQTMTDNMAGLLDSGLHANQSAGISKTYADDRSNLSQEQATKNANYDRQSANTNNSYQAALSAILDKYNGQKAAYVTDMQNKDAERAYASAQADKQMALQRELAAAQNATTLRASSMNQPAAQPSRSDIINQYIAGVHSAFDGYDNNKDVKGYTEQNIQPRLQTLAAQLGVDPDTANSLMYNFRKSQFGQ